MEILIKILEFIKKNWKIIAIIVMLLVLAIQCNSINNLKQDNKRLEDNFYAVCDSADMYKTKSGLLASQTKNLVVTIDELNARYNGASEEIKDLNIKIKNLESYQKGVIEKTIHDTITLRDTIIDNTFTKTGVWSDGCTNMTFEIGADKMYFEFESKDMIDILISKKKEGSWYQFWKWPRNVIYTTTATSLCPNTKVVVNTCKVKN